MIVTVTRTVMDGTVVRWYPTTLAEEHKRPIITASRNGVRIDAWLTDLADSRADAFAGGPLTRLDDAREAWYRLRRNNQADMDDFATHTRKGLNGALEPIERPANAPLCNCPPRPLTSASCPVHDGPFEICLCSQSVHGVGPTARIEHHVSASCRIHGEVKP